MCVPDGLDTLLSNRRLRGLTAFEHGMARMGKQVRIEFLPRGDTKHQRDVEKGRLLERLVADILTSNGYRNVRLNSIVDGTEWDVSGEATLTDAPVIVSCKCLSKSVSPEPLQALAFKVMNLAKKSDPRASGVMVAIPRLSRAAEEFWGSTDDEYRKRVTIYDEHKLTSLLAKTGAIPNVEVLHHIVSTRYQYRPGDSRLLYYYDGLCVAQFVLSPGDRSPTGYLLFDPLVQELPLGDVDRIRELCELNRSDLSEIPCLNATAPSPAPQGTLSEYEGRVHFTVPGTGWFDYKYPASPDYCVGRTEEVREFLDFYNAVKEGRTASRVCIVTGPSGIGKSTFLLKIADSVQRHGGRLFSLNCVSAKGRSFVIAVFSRFIAELRDVGVNPERYRITGLDSLPELVDAVARELVRREVFPIIMFDQFETALLDGPLSESLVELVLSLEEKGSPIIVGFAWKTDLWWPDDHVPYTSRQHLRRSAKAIRIDQFGPSETNQLLRALEEEISAPLEVRLASMVREFSRGYPWLLKKVCWHILEQLRRGVSQREVIERQLDLRSLFEADLDQLDENERDTLRKLASILPADGRTIQESFPELPVADHLNKFVDLRLIIQQGEIYTIYHDIFKEFLRTGRVPIEESYLLKMSPNKSLQIVQLIADVGGSIEVSDLARLARVGVPSLYNYLRDLGSLGFVRVSRGVVSLSPDMSGVETEEDLLRETRLRLSRNTCVKKIREHASRSESLQLDQVVEILRAEFPSVQAQAHTWKHYARLLLRWMNYVLPPGAQPLRIDGVSTTARLVGPKSTAEYPQGFVGGLVRLCELLAPERQLKKAQIAKELGLAEKTVEKAIVDIRLVQFCERLVDGRFRLTQRGRDFVEASDAERRRIFRSAIQEIPFIMKVREKTEGGMSLQAAVDEELAARGKGHLRPATRESLAAVVGDWLRYAYGGQRSSEPSQTVLELPISRS